MSEPEDPGNGVLQKNVEGARDLYRRSLKIRERLAAADPRNVEAQRDLSRSLNKLGSIEEQQGNLAVARDLYQRRLKILLLANEQNVPNAAIDETMRAVRVRILDVETRLNQQSGGMK